jgi:flagellar biosynthesis/type III secretory pathway chaperone
MKVNDGSGLDSMVSELVEVLESHVERHQDLCEVLESKKNALVQLDHHSLEDILTREQAVIEKIVEVESERLRLTERIAESIGAPSGRAMRLAELVSYVDDELRDALLEIRDEIREAADRIDRLNRLSGAMTVQSLGHLNLYIALLAGRDPDAKTYTQQGTSRDDASSFLIDRRI